MASALAVRCAIGFSASLAVIAGTSQLYYHSVNLKLRGLDLYGLVVALILVLYFAALSIGLTFYGIGTHLVEVRPENIEALKYGVYLSLCTYLYVDYALKTSILLFISRVFSTKFIRVTAWALIGFLGIYTVGMEMPFILQCRPIRAAYDLSVGSAACFSHDTLYWLEMSQGIITFLGDVVICLIPLPTVLRLQMSGRNKLQACAAFLIGLGACAACLARLPNLSYQRNVEDFTYAGALPLIWMNLNFCLLFTTFCYPSVTKIWRLAARHVQAEPNSRESECALENIPSQSNRTPRRNQVEWKPASESQECII